MSERWKRPRRRRGLGDYAAAIAQPIARGIDSLLGTDIQNCKSCKERRDKLNGFDMRPLE